MRRVNQILSSTTFAIDGCHVVQHLGIVRGVTVRSRSVFGTIGAKIETIFGGNISLLTSLCERTRQESYDIMVAHAQKLGANAVIGMHYDATEVMAGVTEVLCYGTAVIVEEYDAELPPAR